MKEEDYIIADLGRVRSAAHSLICMAPSHKVIGRNEWLEVVSTLSRWDDELCRKRALLSADDVKDQCND